MLGTHTLLSNFYINSLAFLQPYTTQIFFKARLKKSKGVDVKVGKECMGILEEDEEKDVLTLIQEVYGM